MKTHYRLIDRKGPCEMKVACGYTNAHWTKDTTSDATKVDCKRCLEKIRKLTLIK